MLELSRGIAPWGSEQQCVTGKVQVSYPGTWSKEPGLCGPWPCWGGSSLAEVPCSQHLLCSSAGRGRADPVRFCPRPVVRWGPEGHWWLLPGARGNRVSASGAPLPWKWGCRAQSSEPARGLCHAPIPVSNSVEFSYDLLWFCFSPADEFQMKALPVLAAWTVFSWLLQRMKYLLWLNSSWNGIKLFLSVCSLSGRQITIANNSVI